MEPERDNAREGKSRSFTMNVSGAQLARNTSSVSIYAGGTIPRGLNKNVALSALGSVFVKP